jgi:hypothetical protein
MMWLAGTQGSTSETNGWCNFINNGSPDRNQGSQYKLNPTIGSANNMQYTTSSGGGYSWVGAEIKAGFDSIDVPDGSIFYATDTNKSYVLYNGSWNEL